MDNGIVINVFFYLNIQIMKKLLLLLVAIAPLALISCGGNEQNQSGSANASASATSTAVDAFPWDFPQDVIIEAEPGQLVLAPYTSYPSAIKDGDDLNKAVLIFYKTTFEKGDKTSSALGSEKAQIPNALIIPLKKGEKAKVGDILLTWWQGGSGMQRAIVLDASNPEQPKVNFLDLSFDRGSQADKESMGEKFGNKELEPNSFQIVPDGEWVPGAQVACRADGDWEAGTLIREQGGKVLVSGFASHVKAYDKNDCKLIPFNEDIKVGDMVHAVFVDGYDDGYKVTAVDKKAGTVTCEKNGRSKVYTKPNVTKVL